MDWIEKLAREHGTGGWQTLDDMVRFGKAIAAAEREECAQVCLEVAEDGAGMSGEVWAERCCTEIRKRSNAELTGRGAEAPEAKDGGCSASG